MTELPLGQDAWQLPVCMVLYVYVNNDERRQITQTLVKDSGQQLH